MKMTGEAIYLGVTKIPTRNAQIVHLYSGDVSNVEYFGLWDDGSAQVAQGIKQNQPVSFVLSQTGNFKRLISVSPK